MSNWTATAKTNEWTGATLTTHRRKIEAGPEDHISLQIRTLNGRIYWTANVLIFGRPDINHMSYGMYADVPGALVVAKMRASRIALDAVRKSRTHTLAA